MLLRMRDPRVNRAAVTAAAILGVMLFGSVVGAQNNPDEKAIRQILDNEVATWNKIFETVTKSFSKASFAERL